MKIVQADEVPERTIHSPRQGSFWERRLVTGDPARLDNFLVSMVRLDTELYSPRHRHNFDQFRYQLEGEADFDRNGIMRPGTLTYFPEGAYYGPHKCITPTTEIALQFGGASRSGYMSFEDLERGVVELKQTGTFEGGVYRPTVPGPDGKKNIDAYQAVWEHIHRRPLKYPKPRYDDPIMIRSEIFNWVPSEIEAGVEEKLLGVFSEERVSAGLIRLREGAEHQASGRKAYVVLAGSGSTGSVRYRQYTTTFLEEGERTTFEAESETEVIYFGLPRL